MTLTARVATIAMSALTFATACTAGRTFIPAGQTFMLGGNQSKALRIAGKNVGPVPVEVLAQAGGATQSVATVAPGQGFDRRFEAGETALLRNRSTTDRAVLRFELTEEVAKLSMRYANP